MRVQRPPSRMAGELTPTTPSTPRTPTTPRSPLTPLNALKTLSLVHGLVQDNDVADVTASLEEAPDLLAMADSGGWRLLHVACRYGAVDVAQLLLVRARRRTRAHARSAPPGGAASASAAGPACSLMPHVLAPRRCRHKGRRSTRCPTCARRAPASGSRMLRRRRARMRPLSSA